MQFFKVDQAHDSLIENHIANHSSSLNYLSFNEYLIIHVQLFLWLKNFQFEKLKLFEASGHLFVPLLTCRDASNSIVREWLHKNLFNDNPLQTPLNSNDQIMQPYLTHTGHMCHLLGTLTTWKFLSMHHTFLWNVMPVSAHFYFSLYLHFRGFIPREKKGDRNHINPFIKETNFERGMGFSK